MRTMRTAIIPLFAILLSFASALPVFAQPDEEARQIFSTLMAATIANDYDGFVAVCDDKMKAALTKQMLEGVSAQLKPRADQGYAADYLGELNQEGHAVHLWRLRFKDGGDDVLATLSVKDGKAGGFYIR
jgi:hypothetical protein